MKHLLLIFICSIAFAQNDKPDRGVFSVKLIIDEANTFEQQIESLPYFVDNKILQLFPNDKIYIEAEIENDTIVSLKTVKENLHPEKTIAIEFNQFTDGKVHEQMILMVDNPFSKKLQYNALISILGYQDWHETSIIPILPDLIGYEMWPDLIVSIVLKDWRFVE